MKSVALPDDYVLAPDGSQIRVLAIGETASMVHCRLPVGRVSRAVRHVTVEEIWFGLAGTGKIWRQNATEEAVVAIKPGVSLSISLGDHFQFRNRGDAPLDILITTIPPWPGPQEASRVDDFWVVEETTS